MFICSFNLCTHSFWTIFQHIFLSLPFSPVLIVSILSLKYQWKMTNPLKYDFHFIKFPIKRKGTWKELIVPSFPMGILKWGKNKSPLPLSAWRLCLQSGSGHLFFLHLKSLFSLVGINTTFLNSMIFKYFEFL